MKVPSEPFKAQSKLVIHSTRKISSQRVDLVLDPSTESFRASQDRRPVQLQGRPSLLYVLRDTDVHICKKYASDSVIITFA